MKTAYENHRVHRLFILRSTTIHDTIFRFIVFSLFDLDDNSCATSHSSPVVSSLDLFQPPSHFGHRPPSSNVCILCRARLRDPPLCVTNQRGDPCPSFDDSLLNPQSQPMQEQGWDGKWSTKCTLLKEEKKVTVEELASSFSPPIH